MLEFRDNEIDRLNKECAEHKKSLERCSTEAVRAVQCLKDEDAVMQVRGQLDDEAQVVEAFSILGECEGKLVKHLEALIGEKNEIALESANEVKGGKDLALENLVSIFFKTNCLFYSERFCWHTSPHCHIYAYLYTYT